MATYNREGLLCFVTIEARKRRDDELVATANLQLVECEQLVIVLGFLGFELIEDAVWYQHALRVVDVECSRKGTLWRADARKHEVDLRAAIGAQQLEASAQVINVVYHDAMQSGPQLCYHLRTYMMGLHDFTDGVGACRIGLDVGVAMLYVISQSGPVLLNLAQQFKHLFIMLADGYGYVFLLQGIERLKVVEIDFKGLPWDVDGYDIELIVIEFALCQ